MKINLPSALQQEIRSVEAAIQKLQEKRGKLLELAKLYKPSEPEVASESAIKAGSLKEKVLKFLVENGPSKPSGISNSLGFKFPTTIHRLIKSLLELGLIRQLTDGRYEAI